VLEVTTMEAQIPPGQEVVAVVVALNPLMTQPMPAAVALEAATAAVVAAVAAPGTGTAHPEQVVQVAIQILQPVVVVEHPVTFLAVTVEMQAARVVIAQGMSL
jgi:hypothetical protein